MCMRNPSLPAYFTYPGRYVATHILHRRHRSTTMVVCISTFWYDQLRAQTRDIFNFRTVARTVVPGPFLGLDLTSRTTPMLFLLETTFRRVTSHKISRYRHSQCMYLRRLAQGGGLKTCRRSETTPDSRTEPSRWWTAASLSATRKKKERKKMDD